MNLFVEIHQLLIKKMLEASVDFIIIGGYSVIFHGYKRTTGDIDIWLKPDNTNKEKLLPVLEFFGLNKREIGQVATLDFTKHMNFSLGDEPEKIDFITYINMVNYNDADLHKIQAEVDGMVIPFLHLNDLVLSKINTGRLKDHADVEALQNIEKQRKKL